jgi:hypothetical protein
MTWGDFTAHVLGEDGVTPVQFVRDGEHAVVNAEPFTMRLGDVLDLNGIATGHHLTIGSGDSVQFTFTLHDTA